MLNEKVSELLNTQVNKEFYSAYLYLSFANFYKEQGLDGFANWYQIQAQEERDHAMLFIQYMQNNDVPVTFDAIDKPDAALNDKMDPLKAGDPQTLFPATYYHQVTIVTENSGYADALSTALFTMSYEDGLALIERFRQTYPDQPIEVMWVMDPGQVPAGADSVMSGEYAVVMTDSMKDYLAQ